MPDLSPGSESPERMRHLHRARALCAALRTDSFYEGRQILLPRVMHLRGCRTRHSPEHRPTPRRLWENAYCRSVAGMRSARHAEPCAALAAIPEATGSIQAPASIGSGAIHARMRSVEPGNPLSKKPNKTGGLLRILAQSPRGVRWLGAARH